MKQVTKKKKCCRGWEIDGLLEKLQQVQKSLSYLQKTVSSNRTTIYSADYDICVGSSDRLWHRIVCKYDGNVCLGGTRPHWQSSWSVDEKGFHLEQFVNEQWKGWHGQYHQDNQLKFDELPRDILNLHHNALVKHLENMSIYYPCAIYNDFTGEMYRP